jgi:hypothetical protein
VMNEVMESLRSNEIGSFCTLPVDHPWPPRPSLRTEWIAAMTPAERVFIRRWVFVLTALAVWWDRRIFLVLYIRDCLHSSGVRCLFLFLFSFIHTAPYSSSSFPLYSLTSNSGSHSDSPCALPSLSTANSTIGSRASMLHTQLIQSC